MNSKLEKKIRKQAKHLMVSWLQSVVPDEEKDKVVDKKTWNFICVMFPNVVEEQTIKPTLILRDFSIQEKKNHNEGTQGTKKKGRSHSQVIKRY